MPRFEDLQNAYNQAAQKRSTYWTNVTAATQQLVKEFARYLGVTPDQRIVVVNSAPLPALGIGWFNQLNQFEHRPYPNLPRQGNAMQFALRIVFGTDRAGEVPIEAVFPLSIQQGEEDDIFIVKLVHDLDDKSYRGPSFRTLFDDLSQSALENIIPA